VPNPAQIAVDRPRVVLLAALLLLLYGALSYVGLPRQENPTLQNRFAGVRTYLPGADPERVELLVTEVLEDHVAQVDDLEGIFSTSTFGTSFLLVEVKRTAPARTRLEEIRDKVQEARAELPATASEPEVDLRAFRTNTLVLALAAAEEVPLLALREQARELERDLEGLPDVRRVELRGLPEEEVRVAVDLRRLSQRGLPFEGVLHALADRNVHLPGGELAVGRIRTGIRASGAFARAEEVEATWLGPAATGAGANGTGGAGAIGTRPGDAGGTGAPGVGDRAAARDAAGSAVRLGDVARVERRLADPEVVVRRLGQRAVALGVEMIPGRSATTLGERVRALLAERRATLPRGMDVFVVADEPTYVRERLGLLAGSLLTGLALVVVLSLAGMGWRSGIVVSATIPLALTAAMGLQGLVGIPLHQISIAALVIAIGIVVDEAIVVTDNIQRHLDRGAPPREAAVRGLGEIHLAVLAGAATTVAAFIPLMVMKGDIGDFIRSIPIVVSIMLVASLAVAHFVTPLLAVALSRRWGAGASTGAAASEAAGSGSVGSGTAGPPESREVGPEGADAERAGPEGPGRGRAAWDRLERAYAVALDAATRRRRLVLGGFAALLVGTAASVGAFLMPPAFFPDADRHQFLIRVELPVGSPVEETEAVLAAIDSRLAGDPDLRDWTSFAGADPPKFYYNEFDDGRAEHRGMVIVNTRESVPFRRTRAVAERIDADLDAHVPGARIEARVLVQGYGGGDAVRIYITGDDLDVLRRLATRVREIVDDVAGTANVRESFGYDPLALEARVDAARAGRLGISHRQVATALRSAVDGVVATALRDGDEEIPVRVELAPGQRRNLRDLEALPLWSPVLARTVPLGQVAALEPGWSVREVLRWKRKREAFVRADLAPGHTILDVASRVETAVRQGLALPAGYRTVFEGQREEVTESFVSLAQAGVAAVFLIYILLVLRFGSLAQPALILLAVPMALAGASWGLLATGNPLAFMSFLGMISLTGIAVNDSIVLIDTINRLRGEGMDLVDAVRAGARSRLRAVLMTSLTTMVGLLPLSLGGGDFWAPFGFAMIFGLAGSTLLTLGVQPAAYLALEGLGAGGGRRRIPPDAGARGWMR